MFSRAATSAVRISQTVPDAAAGMTGCATRHRLRLATLATAISAALLLPVSHAQSLEEATDNWLDVVRTFQPYAALGWTTDSNLLRNPDNLNDDSDQYLTLEAGVDARFDVSRQRFLVDGRIFRNSYDRFSEFDYTGGDGRLRWNWAAGKLWEGTLGYTYTRRLRDFANELVPQRDILNRHRVFGSANRWVTNRWRVGASTEWADVSFTESEQLDKNVLGFGAIADYVSVAGNVIGLETGFAATDFSANRADYDDFNVGPRLDWRLSSKTRIRASAGYKSRTHDMRDERDFDGFVARVRTTWAATGKTTILAEAWRDISNLDDEIANFAVVQGISVEPIWNITAKTSLQALASFERRDFQGGDDDDLAVVFDDRVDDVAAFGVGVNWQARRSIALSLGYRAESRDSNRELREYDFQSFEARINVGL